MYSGFWQKCESKYESLQKRIGIDEYCDKY